MPFKSKKQQAWAHTPQGEKALGGPEKVAEWDQATNESALPTTVAPAISVAPHISRVTQR